MRFRDLETDRLALKCMSMDDRDFVLEEFSDSDINRYLFDAEPMQTLADADELIRFYLQPDPRAQNRWILVLKDGGEKIGTCGFHCWNREMGRAEMGYDLKSAYRGMGLMREAAREILRFGFEEMRLSAVDAHIYPENQSSARLAERLGFAFEGEETEYVFRGKAYAHRVYTYRAATLALMDEAALPACAALFIDTFEKAPWNDVYESRGQVDEFFRNYRACGAALCYTLARAGEIVGLCLGIEKPWIEGTEYYIDEFCVKSTLQGRGLGSLFLALIEKDIHKRGMNAMLLSTENGYPAEAFYRKNGFHTLPNKIFLAK